MVLSKKQIKFLRAQAHHLKPVVTVGMKGLSEPVLQETNKALDFHELIKIKLPAGQKSDRQTTVEEICTRLDAFVVGLTGRTAIIYRRNQRKKDPMVVPEFESPRT